VINYCPVCHNKLPENSIFCPYCGAQVKKSVYTSSRTNKKNFESPETENITKPKFLKSKKLSNLQQVKLDSYLENAKVAFDDGEYAVAIDYYIKATKIDKKNYKLFYNLGVAHYFAKNYFDSKLSFEKSLEKKENDVDTLLYLGSVNDRLGLLNDSESCFKKVLEIDPKNKIAMKNLHKLQSIRK
jgi:tetratricopeptide (TPR) repeat protein